MTNIYHDADAVNQEGVIQMQNYFCFTYEIVSTITILLYVQRVEMTMQEEGMNHALIKCRSQHLMVSESVW